MSEERDKKPGLVPRLRFPEFREAGEWANPKLEDISIPIEERVGDRKLIPISISAGIGFVPQAEKFGRDISGSQYRLYTLVRDGDFVYNKGNSLKFPQGCVYDLRGWGEVAVPNVFICFRLKAGYSNGFFRYCFEKNIHGLQLRKHITSGARSNGLLNISKEAFFGIRIPTPKHEEQQKIADCLSSLDEKIAAETQKLDALKTHKKGLMQQLFPVEGETVPRLRFPEFRKAGEWEKKNLADICLRITNGKANSEDHEDDGIYPLYDRSEIAKRSNEYAFDDEAVIIPGEGMQFQPKYHKGKFNLHQRAYALMQHQGNAKFVYYTLDRFKDTLAKNAVKSTVLSLRLPIIEQFSLAVPDQKEQQKIADCLSALDDLIAAQAQKIELLKRHKKGLMQQLFPVLDEAAA